MSVVIWQSDPGRVVDRIVPARKRCDCGRAVRVVNDGKGGTIVVEDEPTRDGQLVVNVDTVIARLHFHDPSPGFRAHSGCGRR